LVTLCGVIRAALESIKSGYLDKQAKSMLKKVAKVIGSGGAAQLLYIIALPLLSRLYDPVSYGIYGLFVASLALTSIAGSLRWELALVHQESDADFVVFTNSFYTILGSTTIVGGIVLAVISPMLSDQAILMGVILLLCTPLSCIYSLHEMFCIKLNAYTVYFWGRFLKIVLLVIVQLAFGYMDEKPSWTHLAAAHIAALLLSPVLAALLSVGGAKVLRNLFPRRAWSFKEIKSLYTRERGHLYSNGPQAVMNSVGQSAPYYIIGLASSSFLGFYAMADRIIRAPLNLVSSAVKQVVTNHVAEDLTAAKKITMRVMMVMAATGFPATAVMLLFGDQLLSLLLGPSWAVAGDVAGYLVLYACGALVNFPVLASLRAIRKHNVLIHIELLMLIGKVLSLVIGIYIYDPMGAVKLYSVSSFIMYVLASLIGFLMIDSFNRGKEKQ
jgi:lipopolysaccharide exporter